MPGQTTHFLNKVPIAVEDLPQYVHALEDNWLTKPKKNHDLLVLGNLELL